ncbi:MAG: YqaA family protein [Vicinamibacteraceae bacterium]
MSRFIDWIERAAASWGGPGLFVVAFLDSSFISLPQINDILIIWMVTREPQRLLYYATMQTLGSVAGCLVVYGLGRKGGEALLRRRFKSTTVDRATALFERWGAFAVLVPALLPPPAPFKLFVLLGGVMRVKLRDFVMAILIGRGVRYFGEGLLAYYYGAQAIEFLKTHGRTVSLTAVAVVVAGLAIYLVWQRFRPGQPRAARPNGP